MAGPFCPRCGHRFLTFGRYLQWSVVNRSARHACEGCGAQLAPVRWGPLARRLPSVAVTAAVSLALAVCVVTDLTPEVGAGVCLGVLIMGNVTANYWIYRSYEWTAEDPVPQ
jgi:hypothetical protein